MTDHEAVVPSGQLVPLVDGPLPLEQTVVRDRHPAYVYVARLSPGSRRTMRGALETIAAIVSNGQQDATTLCWASLRYQHTTAIRTALMERYTPAGANLRLAALRGVLREAWRLGQMTADDYRRAVDLPGITGHTLPRGRALSVGELRALFSAFARDTSPAGRRDAALLVLLYAGGLRRGEAVALDLEDYTADTGELRIRQGKGRKDRLVYVNGGRPPLADWLQVRGGDPGPLFVAINQRGRLIPHRLTAQVVRTMLLKRAREAGVTTFSPHDLRRTFISDLLDAGADLSTVQQLAGHSNVTTTARYDRRGEAAKKKTAGLLHVPYVWG